MIPINSLIDAIVVNKARTEATIYYTHRAPFNLYHSEGEVDTLILWMITNTKIEVKYSDFLRYKTEDTCIIESEVL
jgi:hypothetical protein